MPIRLTLIKAVAIMNRIWLVHYIIVVAMVMIVLVDIRLLTVDTGILVMIHTLVLTIDA